VSKLLKIFYLNSRAICNFRHLILIIHTWRNKLAGHWYCSLFFSFVLMRQHRIVLDPNQERSPESLYSEELCSSFALISRITEILSPAAGLSVWSRCVSCQAQSDQEEAINYLREASGANYDPMAWYYFGYVLHRNFSFDEAIKAYSKFLVMGKVQILSRCTLSDR